MNARHISIVALLLASVVCGACGTSLFKVKPATELPPFPTNSRESGEGGVIVRVAPLLNDEESEELFGTNLLVSGILAVRVELKNGDGVAVNLKRAKFRVRDNQNREWKLISTKKAVSRVMKANGISLYNPNAKKQFISDLGAYALDVKTPLDSNQLRSGFLFFQTPDKRPVEPHQKLVLVVDRLPQNVSISLN